MCSLSRSSCGKAFCNWSRGKTFRPMKSKWGGGGGSPKSPLDRYRVNKINKVVCNCQSKMILPSFAIRISDIIGSFKEIGRSSTFQRSTVLPVSDKTWLCEEPLRIRQTKTLDRFEPSCCCHGRCRADGTGNVVPRIMSSLFTSFFERPPMMCDWRQNDRWTLIANYWQFL